MATEQGKSRAGGVARATFGVVLFIIWGILTILWVYDAIYQLVVHGEAGPAIRAVVALLLMFLLACMEGLEVAVIDRWSHLYPDRAMSDLAGWLAARQLFVALIVTAATMLAERDPIAIPFSSTVIEEPYTKIFNLVWTGLTVLWFMQIFPKHMAATNADRYLDLTRRPLFPVVEFVRVIGIAWPAVKTAQAVQNRLDWHPEPVPETVPSRGAVSLAAGWAALTPEDGRAAQRPLEQ